MDFQDRYVVRLTADFFGSSAEDVVDKLWSHLERTSFVEVRWYDGSEKHVYRTRPIHDHDDQLDVVDLQDSIDRFRSALDDREIVKMSGPTYFKKDGSDLLRWSDSHEEWKRVRTEQPEKWTYLVDNHEMRRPDVCFECHGLLQPVPSEGACFRKMECVSCRARWEWKSPGSKPSRL